MRGDLLTLGSVAVLAASSAFARRGSSATLRPVAALYVDRERGPYAHLPGVTAYGIAEDATTYNGPVSCVLHPPCGHWGNYSAKAHDDGHTGPIAVAQVRRWGGVLEHPRRSKLWKACDMPLPGEPPDSFGGYTLLVDQHDWGHPAQKATWLYVVGVAPENLPAFPPHLDPPPATVPGRVSRGVVERMAKSKRHLTPPLFAAWLVELARRAKRPAGSSARTGGLPAHLAEEARYYVEILDRAMKRWGVDPLTESADFMEHESELERLFHPNLLGFGNQRIVIASSDPAVVIKLDPQGMGNQDESAFWRDAGPQTRSILVPVLQGDPDGRWLLMERVKPLRVTTRASDVAFQDLIDRARVLGLTDVNVENVSSDFRILDYAEPITSVGSPSRVRVRRGGEMSAKPAGSRAFRGQDLRARLVAILEDYVDIHLALDADALNDLISRFGEAGATFLASGSQRLVFDLGDGTVGKVDYDVDATANGLEAKNWKTWRAVRPLLCPVLYTSPGDRLLVMPFAESITEPASGKPPVKSRVKKMEAAMQTFGPGGVYLFDYDFDLNWGWYNDGPVLLDYAQESE